MQPDLARVQQATSLSWALTGMFNGSWKAINSMVACLRPWPRVPAAQCSKLPRSQLTPAEDVFCRSSSVNFVSVVSATSIEDCETVRSSSCLLRTASSSLSPSGSLIASASLSLRRSGSLSRSLESRKAADRSAVAAAAAEDFTAARNCDDDHAHASPSPSVHQSRYQGIQDALPTLALAAAALSCGILFAISGSGRLLRGLLLYGALEFAFQAWQQRRCIPHLVASHMK